MKKLLIFVSLTGIAAVVGAVVVGTVMFDGTVVGNPYERGIAWDEEKKRRLSSGLKVSIDPAPFRKGKNEIVVRVLDEKDEPVAAEGLALFFSRTVSSDHDRRYVAAKQGDGTYRAAVELPEKGRWEIVVAVESGGSPLEFRFEIYAGD